jgi:hypothetical protein
MWKSSASKSNATGIETGKYVLDSLRLNVLVLV